MENLNSGLLQSLPSVSESEATKQPYRADSGGAGQFVERGNAALLLKDGSQGWNSGGIIGLWSGSGPGVNGALAKARVTHFSDWRQNTVVFECSTSAHWGEVPLSHLLVGLSPSRPCRGVKKKEPEEVGDFAEVP